VETIEFACHGQTSLQANRAGDAFKRSTRLCTSPLSWKALGLDLGRATGLGTLHVRIFKPDASTAGSGYCLCCRQIANQRIRNLVTEDSLEEPELPVLLYWNCGFGSPNFLLPRWSI
jgi:hypothetical protein